MIYNQEVHLHIINIQINDSELSNAFADLKSDEGKDDSNSVTEGTNDGADTNSTQDSGSNYSYQSEPVTVGYMAGSLIANEPIEGKDKYKYIYKN